MNFNPKIHKELFLGFLRAGMLGYGGGPASIPLVHKEAVEKYKWMTDEEFSNILAIGNTLPGPIITKMSGYIGYKMAGLLGLINALIASVLPTVLLMIGLTSYIALYRDLPRVNGMLQAITPVVGVMLFSLTYSFIKQSKVGLGWFKTIVIGCLSLFFFQFLNVHPAFIVGALLLYGFFSVPGKD
ncbi:chromate transporter [Desulfitispora alkaliphila]|uniref:chromate transporter n=1 Tax=Desulfitispora alkaliphila TaxID=622674 RepID=UPI003D2427E1